MFTKIYRIYSKAAQDGLLFKVLKLLCATIFLTSGSLEAKSMNDDQVNGVIYFSDGASLIRYNFSTKEKEVLFKQGENSELGKKLTNIEYPVYLKSKNRILFIGSTPYPDPNHNYIFESDLDLKNMKQYRNMNNVQALSLSPDESLLAYYRHPNKLVIKKYTDLERDNHEKVVADNLLVSSRPLWLSNTVIVYNSIDNKMLKLDIQSSEQQIMKNNTFCSSISPDGKYILAFFSDNKNSYIDLYDLNSSNWKVIVKGAKQQVSSPEIWAPDGKRFVFTKLRGLIRTFNIRRLLNDLVASLEERHDLYIYSLNTGEESKIIEDELTFGGFWIGNDAIQ